MNKNKNKAKTIKALPKTKNPGMKNGGCSNYKHRDFIVHTQCNQKKREMIANCFAKYPGGTFCEIGVFGGATLLHLIPFALKTNGKIIGIDPFEKIEIFNGEVFKKMSSERKKIALQKKQKFKNRRLKLQQIISHYKYEGVVTLHCDISNNVKNKIPQIDVLFVDGDHSYSGVYSDLRNYYDKVKKGGVIIGDDFSWHSIKSAVVDFCKHKEIKFEDHKNIFVIRK